ncbi:glycosyltransferase [Thauera propionica]|jgi:glycosyltransferase involved in cell wall biosynthesis|uniref:glycosyltransferase n=1 Tax=Thauera propionica TaxID=2019431 RepID=UPI0023F32C70|nr:glycosyltransferase [Thauera propionica]MDD3675504.1 glycosyltransferase [Thauera propionica]
MMTTTPSGEVANSFEPHDFNVVEPATQPAPPGAGRVTRVLHVGKFFPPHPGGMETFLADLVAAQRRQGMQVAVLVHGEPRPDDPDWLVRVPVAFSLIYAPVSPGFRRAFKRCLRRFSPELIHLHLPNNSAFWALSLKDARRIPWVVHWHSDVLVTNARNALSRAYTLYRPFEQAVLRRANHVIATSPDYLAASEPLSHWREKSVVVPLGLDTSQLLANASDYPAQVWPQEGLRLLSVGRLAHYKGFDTLIRAVAAVPNASLVIAGEGEERHALAALIDELTPPGQAPRIALLGAIDNAAKNALLAACDAFCLASCERTEAFGIAVMEAMTHGKPCLVSELQGSGLPWLVRSSRAGRTLPVGDVAAWRQAIGELSDGHAQHLDWGNAGKHAIAQFFSIEVCERRIAAIYDDSCCMAVPSSVDPASLLVVIPARDEADSITKVIAALQKLGLRHILVINDQSTDDTAQLALQSGAVVLNPVLPLGAWGAMQAGIRYALRHGFQHVVTIDADGQHEPACIPDMLDAARGHDVVIGAHPERASPSRKLAWRYFRLIAGFNIEDLTSGFRCYNRAACEILADDEATLLDYQDVGVLLLLRKAGLKIVEVPVAMYPRLNGPSRIFGSWPRILRYMLESTLLCLASWHPRHLFRR